MEQKLREVLSDKQGNYILPFFWQHGEAEDKLVEEVEKIYQSGVKAMCLESRTHEEFAKEGWFHDFDIILREAKKRNMKIWVLDDKHFPTGYANGLIAEKYPHLRKWHLVEHHVDVMGPQKGAILLEAMGENPAAAERTLLCALAYPRQDSQEVFSGEPIDVTHCVKDKFFYWEAPEGCWRVFFFYKTREGAAGAMYANYIHMIDPQSVDVLLEAVYEPHYQRYANEFGKTIAGFFSDEPCLGNGTFESGGVEPRFYDSTIGFPHLALPYVDGMLDSISEKMGCQAKTWLAGLWYPVGDQTANIRVAYMDVMTALYRDSFCNKLGNWCRERGVEYIGHVIEDMNCHAHMGNGSGHYFRNLCGQDMSGIDVVLQQIVPGMGHFIHNCVSYSGKADPEFFDYVLAKQAASLSHMVPHMRGRAMCEMYGAYGWAEGTPMMKWLTDHMLVRGVNHFVPHAFTPVFPDYDCPPHFYARGNNPQYRDFKTLMVYTNKMSHLLTGGDHVASAAILYHAEAEWSGGRYMKTQVPAKILCDSQIDYDIIPIDALADAGADNGKLAVGRERFGAMIVPQSEILPYACIENLNRLALEGVPVIFVDEAPKRSCENKDISRLMKAPFLCVARERLVSFLLDKGIFDIRLKQPDPMLRFYHYVREGSHFYMFFNEGMTPIRNTVVFPMTGDCLTLDLLGDKTVRQSLTGHELPLSLLPYQSLVVAFTDGIEEIPLAPKEILKGTVDIAGPFVIEGAEMSTYPSFEAFREEGQLGDVTAPDRHPAFGGIIRYTASFSAQSADRLTLDLGEVGETARVTVNGQNMGSRICRPYTFDITEAVTPGTNTLVVEVANSLAYQQRDNFSKGLMISASGLLGPVTLSRFMME